MQILYVTPRVTQPPDLARDYSVTSGVTSPASPQDMPPTPSPCAVHLRPWSCINTPALRQLPRPLGAGSILPHVTSVLHDPARCVDAPQVPASA